MEEYFGFGFPAEKLKKQVYSREPGSPGVSPLWCLDTSADGSCSSGVMVRARSMVAWTPSALQHFEFAQMQRVRRTDRPNDEQLTFLYAGQPVAFEFPRLSNFPWDVIATFAASVEAPYPELSNVCPCRLPVQTHALLRLIFMFFAGGKVRLDPRVTDAEQAARFSYRKAWFTIGDDSLFFTIHRGVKSYEEIVHRQPLADVQNITTHALPTDTQLRNAVLRNLWTAVGLGIVVFVLTLIGVSGEKVPGERIAVAALGSLVFGILFGGLMLMLPDAVRARTPLTLHLLKLQDGSFLAVAADAKQPPQLARLLGSFRPRP